MSKVHARVLLKDVIVSPDGIEPKDPLKPRDSVEGDVLMLAAVTYDGTRSSFDSIEVDGRTAAQADLSTIWRLWVSLGRNLVRRAPAQGDPGLTDYERGLIEYVDRAVSEEVRRHIAKRREGGH